MCRTLFHSFYLLAQDEPTISSFFFFLSCFLSSSKIATTANRMRKSLMRRKGLEREQSVTRPNSVNAPGLDRTVTGARTERECTNDVNQPLWCKFKQGPQASKPDVAMWQTSGFWFSIDQRIKKKMVVYKNPPWGLGDVWRAHGLSSH